MTGLKYIEDTIDRLCKIPAYELPGIIINLPKKEEQLSIVHLFEPCFWFNASWQIGRKALIDLSLRIITAIPTIGYDLTVGLGTCSRSHLYAGLITIPRGILNLIKDVVLLVVALVNSLIIVAILVGIAGYFILSVLASLFQSLFASVGSLTEKILRPLPA
jgi:hypothetical protein